MDIVLLKTQTGFLPGDPGTEEWYRKIKAGEAVHGQDFTKIRNYEFFKKYFALLRIGFDNFEPPEIDTKWGKPQKNFDTFRKNIAILCGFGEPVFNIDGTYKMEAKSISFANMGETEFSKLYGETIDVLIRKIYGGEMTPEKLDDIVQQYLGFA